MKLDSIRLLIEPEEIHDFVAGLWSDGPIRRSHLSGGYVSKLIDRFARIPRFFYEASNQILEWTHFSTWWGGILLCDYENETIRDLRYLHEIHHAATMPYIRGANVPTFEAMNFRNEREASTFTEMAIYLELPDLRPLTFAHPLFVDRFLFPDGDLERPAPDLLARWQREPDLVLQELMYERMRVILADESEIDADDPQVVWLRRYGEQGANWIRVWSRRFNLVQEAMITLREASASGDRATAARSHLDWLLSPAISGGSDIPFEEEAIAFRRSFDELIAVYDRAMTRAHQVPVKGL